MLQPDIDTLLVGGYPKWWIFTDSWGTDKSTHKDGDIFRIDGFKQTQSNDGKTKFWYVELTKITENKKMLEIQEEYRLSTFALKSVEKIKAKDLIKRYITIKKDGSRLFFTTLTPEETTKLQ